MSVDLNLKEVGKACIRSVGASVPALSAWVQLWNEHEAVELSRRLERFWSAFKHEAECNRGRFNELEKDLRYIQESMTVLHRAVAHASREPDERKQEFYAVATIRSWASGPDVPRDRKLSIIDTIDSLTVTDIDVLLRFRKQSKLKVGEMLSVKVGREPGFTDRERLGYLVATLAKLESRGLIAVSSSSHITIDSYYGDQSQWDNEWRRRYYQLLPFGEDFLENIGPLRSPSQ